MIKSFKFMKLLNLRISSFKLKVSMKFLNRQNQVIDEIYQDRIHLIFRKPLFRNFIVTKIRFNSDFRSLGSCWEGGLHLIFKLVV
jgi:hypothetical protein